MPPDTPTTRACEGSRWKPDDAHPDPHEHQHSRLRVENTGLGIDRSSNLVVIRVLTRPRTRDAKLAFHRLLAE